MGHMLRRLGVKIEGEVGSLRRFLGVAMANVEQPELVARAHEAYIAAGASVITTNSYACVPACLELAGASRDELREHIRAAGRVAQHAVQASRKPGLRIAGCLPPLSATYRPDLVGDSSTLLDEYAFIAETIAPYSQVLLCETMSTIREGLSAATAASASGLPVWFAWNLSESADGTLRSGETIEAAVAAIMHIPNLEAILVNCSSPEAVDAVSSRLRGCAPISIAVGAYANGFVIEGRGQRDEYREDLSPEKYLARAQRWVDDGSTIIGGCCGVFPEHIELLSARLVPSANADREFEGAKHADYFPSCAGTVHAVESSISSAQPCV